MAVAPPFRTRALPLFVLVILLTAAAAMLLSHSMFARLDHDEHQFVAGGALLARNGLLPYRDYAYFHMPYLIGIYAVLFTLTDHLLLAARLFSTVCGFATLVLVGWIAARLFANHASTLRWLMAASSVLIVAGNPLFIFTSGRSWNHDFPTMVMLIAVMALCRGLRDQTATMWFAITGALMGLAVGTRLTFAPAALIIPSALIIGRWLQPATKLRAAGTYLLGFFVAMIPCAILMLMAPDGFIFGNLEYPFFNTTYRAAERYQNAMTIFGKLKFLCTNVFFQPGNIVPGMLCAGTVLAAMRFRARDTERWNEVQLLLILVLALLLGSFAPTPLYLPYFHTPMIFIVVTALYAASLWPVSVYINRLMSVFAVASIISLPYIVFGYRDVVRLAKWNDWIPLSVHKEGIRLAAAAEHGRVLTLAPIFPLEGQAQIYPELATGPFAWRISPFVDETMESRLKVLDPDDLTEDLRQRAPAAVFVGVEMDLEAAILNYAQDNDVLIVYSHKSRLLAGMPSFLTASDTQNLETR